MRRRLASLLGPLALYVAASVAFFGRGVARDPHGSVVGQFGSDQGFFMWSMSHWLRVLEGREHAFLTDRIWYPDGFNLAWATVIPGPSLAVAPVTWLAGPEPAYNVLALLAPALAAFTTYLLCRELTGRVGPSLVGGAVFGFSSYLATQTLNHVNLALVFPLPLAVLLVVRHVLGRTSDRRLVLGTAAVLVLQFSIFTEMLLGLVVFGGAAGVLALLLAGPALRPRLARAACLVLGGGLLAGLVVAPYVWYAFAHPNPIHGQLRPDLYVVDAGNVLFPTRVAELGGGAFADRSARFAGNLTEQLAYVPLPLLALALVTAVAWRRSFAGRLLPAVIAVSAICAMGAHLTWHGKQHLTLPWALIGRLPVLELALPTRFIVHAWLALAVLVALVLAAAGPAWTRRLRWAAALAGLVMLLPVLDAERWTHPLAAPPFFTDGSAQRVLGDDAVVMLLPYGFLANGMYWQAKAGMSFRQAGGYASSTVPDPYLRYPIVRQLYTTGRRPTDAASLRELLRDKGATHVVVDARHWSTYRALLADAGLSGRTVAGVIVYRVPPGL